jgi:hypothetical protein
MNKNQLTILSIVIGFIIIGSIIAIIISRSSNPTSLCNTLNKTYLSNDSNCIINFLCIQGTQAFHDSCGCGCGSVNYCTSEQQNATFCAQDYAPVCATLSTGDTQTFPNSCIACSSQAYYWLDGPC